MVQLAGLFCMHAGVRTKLHLHIQLEQRGETVDQHKGCALLICILDAHICRQLAVCAPAELAPCDVAKNEHQHLQEQRYYSHRDVAWAVSSLILKAYAAVSSTCVQLFVAD